MSHWVQQADPAGQSYQSTLQAWAKPLKGADGVAVLLINPTASAMKFDVPLNVLPLAGSGANLTAAAVKSRDIWQHAAGPSIACPGPACAVQTTVPAMDSVFLRLYH